MSLLKLLGIRKSCVPLSSGTLPIQCGVKKKVISSAKAGKAPRAVWSLFVFLYSTVENYEWFKESVTVLYCLTPEERAKEVFGYMQQGISCFRKWNIVPLVPKFPADADFSSNWEASCLVFPRCFSVRFVSSWNMKHLVLCYPSEAEMLHPWLYPRLSAELNQHNRALKTFSWSLLQHNDGKQMPVCLSREGSLLNT